MSKPTLNFFNLTPEVVLSASESAGFIPTGEFSQLNSYENRVFDIRLEDQDNIVAKFYRPGRWSKEAILEEHEFLIELKNEGIPAVAPLIQKSNKTISVISNLYVTFFPKIRARMPDEFIGKDLFSVGALLARIHNVGAQHKSLYRPIYTPQDFSLWKNLEFMEKWIAPEVIDRYLNCAEDILEVYEKNVKSSEFQRIHGDCHRGNLLSTGKEFFMVDFDDFGMGPVIQDFWMLLSGDDDLEEHEKELLISGYESLRTFPYHQWEWIPLLRGFRIINYAMWIAKRWDDPSFPKIFPQFNTYKYWAEETEALEKILQIL